MLVLWRQSHLPHCSNVNLVFNKVEKRSSRCQVQVRAGRSSQTETIQFLRRSKKIRRSGVLQMPTFRSSARMQLKPKQQLRGPKGNLISDVSKVLSDSLA
jgi:hypothetical protein